MGNRSRADECRGGCCPQGEHSGAAGSVVLGDELTRSVRPISTIVEGDDALRICAIASNPGAVMRATSRREEVAHTGQTMWCSRPSVVRFDAAGDVPNRSDERVVAMCRCLEWPQAVSGCR
jgi:hypothetical protein